MRFKEQVFSLIKDWCDTLLKTQLDIPDNPLLDGAILCPACAMVHGRCADMILPLMLLYKETNDNKYLVSAKKLVAWTEYNLLTVNNDYRNDVANRWKGTNIFSCLAIGETLHRFGDLLDSETREKWTEIFKRNTFSAIEFIEKAKPHINYNAGAAALFAFAYHYTNDKRFLEPALKQEQFCQKHFDVNGLLFGEGTPHDGKTHKGCRFIDIGYNLEESIPLLINHSLWLKDNEKLKFYTDRAIDHLEFLLPDGAIDNSWGTRQNKWTYWGSRTSDGMHEGFVHIAKNNPIIAKAIKRNVELLNNCTVNGKLYGGPMYESANEPACVHHAFDHAKSVAVLYLEMGDEFDNCDAALLPREAEGVKLFQNGQLYTVTRGEFVATVNACDTHIYEKSETGGGAISMLWSKQYGPIIAATLNRFTVTEPYNMQIQRHAETEAGLVARVGESHLDKTVTLTANNNQIIAESKQSGFKICYNFEEDAVFIKVVSAGNTVYHLPIVTKQNDSIEVLNKEIIFKNTLCISFDGECILEPSGESRYFHPVGGFQHKELIFDLKANLPLNIKIWVRK